MFPICAMTRLGAALLCIAVGWVVLGAGGGILRFIARFFVTVLAVGCIAAGVAVFSHASHRPAAPPHRHAAAAANSVHVELEGVDLDDVDDARHRVREIHVDPAVRFERNFPFQRGLPFQHGFPFEDGISIDEDREYSAGLPKWLVIALGTVLVIGGSLLFRRERSRPRALKAFTLLGLAATGFILFSFFNTPSRHVAQSHDRVVKVSAGKHEPAADVAREVVEKREANRPGRAARPMARAKKPLERDRSIEQLPPRAGEIPVAAELAKTEPEPTEKAPVESAPAQASPVEPAPVKAEAIAEPAQPTAAEAAAKTDEPAATKAAEPDAAQPAPSAAPEPPAAEAEPKAPEQPAVQPAEPPVVAPQAPQAPVESPDPPTPAAPAPTAEPRAAEAAPAVPSPPAVAATEVIIENKGDRPSWVEMRGKLDGSVYRTSVVSGVYVDVPECQRALDAQIKHAADQYINDYLGPGTAALVNIPRGYLFEHVKKAEYGEVVQASVGPMHQIHALLEFDDDARAVFHERWRNTIVTDRLWYVGSAGAVLLALMGTVYGYLKLDLRTGGAQSGRLQLAATLVALIVAAGALLARWAVTF